MHLKRIASVVSIALASAVTATPQGRPVDWPSLGGDARRSGWERSDTRITKDNVKDFQLVLKRKFDGPKAGPYALTPPVIIGLLISYKGFKELGFVAGNSGDLWSLDVDTDRLFWHKKFDAGTKGGGAACAGMATAPALTPPLTFTRRPGAAGPKPPVLPARLGGGGFGGARPVYYVAGDGKLRHVNSSDGSELFPSLDFLPPNAKTSSLLMTNNTIYALTAPDCGGAANALYSIDLAKEETKVASYPVQGGGAFAVGADGTVYLQTAASLEALTPKEMKPKERLTLPPAMAGANIPAPVVFEYKGKDLIAAAGADGRIRLIDSAAVGSELAQSVPIASGKGHLWGGLSSWEDADGGRWIAAPVWGALSPDLKFPAANGATPNGSIAVFKLEETNGKFSLAPAWVSRDLKSPVAPVIASGIVFALSTADRATLFAFDGATGKEVYSTGTQVNAPASLTGLAVANGRVFFTTTDNTLYAFGVFLEI